MLIKSRRQKFDRSSPYTQDFDGAGFPSRFSLTIYLEAVFKKNDRVAVLFQLKRDLTTEKVIARAKDNVYREIPKCLLNAKFTTSAAARLSLLCKRIQKQSGINDNREVLAYMVETVLRNTGDGKEDPIEIIPIPLSSQHILQKVRNGCKGDTPSSLWKSSWVLTHEPILPIVYPTKGIFNHFTDPPIPNPPPKELEDAWKQSLEAPLWTLDEFLTYWENTGSSDFLLSELMERIPGRYKNNLPSKSFSSHNKTEIHNNFVPDSLGHARSSETKGTSVEPENSFIKSGNIWTIRYEGKELNLKEAKGLTYIAHLLEHPNEEIPVEQLDSLYNASPVGRARHISNRKSNEEMSEEELNKNSKGQVKYQDIREVADSKAKAEYKESIKYINKEIDKAKRKNDLASLKRLKEEKSYIVEELKRITGFNGQSRKFNNTKEKIRKAVFADFKNILKKIEQSHQALAQHLSQSIKTGGTCSYKPHPPNDWKL